MSEAVRPGTENREEVKHREPTRGQHYFSPPVDIVETEQGLVLYADMPGVKSDGVDLRYERGELILHGKVAPRPMGKTLLLGEAPVGDYYRVFTISETIDANRIEAEFKQGVLVVHLPKVASVKPRQIQVKMGS